MPDDLNKAHFAIIAHCVFEGGSIHHWMHNHPGELPSMPYNLAATVMDKTGGQSIARACIIFKCDMPADDPQMGKYISTVVNSVNEIGSLLARPAHFLLLVAFKMSDPQALPNEIHCLRVFTRQNLEHSVQGSA